jgi:hypothetical protein
MSVALHVTTIIFAIVVFAVVFEMTRRRSLEERYAILWLGTAVALLVLAAWPQLLSHICKLTGISTPSNGLFAITLAFLLLLLIHVSAVASRLSDETRRLAQRLALMEQELRRQDARDIER